MTPTILIGEWPKKGIPPAFLAKNGGPEDCVLHREPKSWKCPIFAGVHRVPLLVSILVDNSLF